VREFRILLDEKCSWGLPRFLYAKITAINLITDYDSQYRTASTGQPVQDGPYRTASTGQPAQDSQYRTASTGQQYRQPVQDSQCRIAVQDSQYRITVQGRQE
jgi:hypothetical protein